MERGKIQNDVKRLFSKRWDWSKQTVMFDMDMTYCDVDNDEQSKELMEVLN